jgi:hypothetical protein
MPTVTLLKICISQINDDGKLISADFFIIDIQLPVNHYSKKFQLDANNCFRDTVSVIPHMVHQTNMSLLKKVQNKAEIWHILPSDERKIISIFRHYEKKLCQIQSACN